MAQDLARIEYKPTEIGTERLGQIMVKSGFFKDATDEAKAIVKILCGAELGFGPMASMTGIFIVEGKPSLSSHLIAAAIQKSGRFNYRVRETTAEKCRIEYFEQGQSLGTSEFTMQDATTAGLAKKGPWTQYPKAMLWARAMSQGARAYCPAVFNGAIYTPDELGAVVTDEGMVVDSNTGEVLSEPRRESVEQPSQAEPDFLDDDLVSDADDKLWQLWLRRKREAEQLGARQMGLNLDDVKLGIRREQLLKVGADLKAWIAKRRADAAA